MRALEQHINYQFKQKELLREALTHSSFGYENGRPYNERLEFLGDSVLGFVVSRALFDQFPGEPEGILSKMKSVLVSASVLSEKAKLLGLGDSLFLGKGEKKAGGDKKPSILADAMEALIGAILLDGGSQEAERFIHTIYREDFEQVTREIKNAVDFKTVLQEKAQELGLGLPTYVVDAIEGPAHSRRFQIHVEIGSYHGPSAEGTSKKSAHQECAKKLLNDETFWRTMKANAP